MVKWVGSLSVTAAPMWVGTAGVHSRHAPRTGLTRARRCAQPRPEPEWGHVAPWGGGLHWCASPVAERIDCVPCGARCLPQAPRLVADATHRAGAMMVATLKLISTAVCYQDGLAPAQARPSACCCAWRCSTARGGVRSQCFLSEPAHPLQRCGTSPGHGAAEPVERAATAPLSGAQRVPRAAE